MQKVEKLFKYRWPIVLAYLKRGNNIYIPTSPGYYRQVITDGRMSNSIVRNFSYIIAIKEDPWNYHVVLKLYVTKKFDEENFRQMLQDNADNITYARHLLAALNAHPLSAFLAAQK